MLFTRRQFLGTGGAAALLGGSVPAWPLGVATAAQASRAPSPTLVVIFLRGGVDGLNLVVPHGDEDYYRLRPSLAIPRPGEARGAIDLGAGFGLHPAAAPLAPLFESGVAAAVHAVGHPDNTRSHFEEQDRLEVALTDPELGTPGWLGRYLASTPARGPIRAMALGDRVPRSLRGPVPAVALRGLDELAVRGDSSVLDATVRALEESYGGSAGGAMSSKLARGGRTTLDALQQLAEVASAPFEARGDYPDNPLGRSLREVARLIHSDLGVEVLSVDYDGWDTHQNQAQPFTGRVDSLARAIDALHTDLEDRLDDVMVLTVSEFGRTAAQNGTRGTDHGHAGCLLAMGGALRARKDPKRVLGTWPGLSRETLNEGRDLRITTDIRDVYAEVLSAVLGVEDLGKVLPGWKRGKPGLLV